MFNKSFSIIVVERSLAKNQAAIVILVAMVVVLVLCCLRIKSNMVLLRLNSTPRGLWLKAQSNKENIKEKSPSLLWMVKRMHPNSTSNMIRPIS